MPGTCLHCSFERFDKLHKHRLVSAVQSLIVQERYESIELHESDNIYIGFVAYSQYPRMVIEHGEHKIFVEGAIYGKSKDRIAQELLEHAENLLSLESNSESRFARWLLSTNGEFNVVIIDALSDHVIVANDALGRLPMFIHRGTKSVTLAREQKFILALNPELEFSRLGIAEYLIFGHGFGTRTLVDGIRSLEPATMLRFSLRDEEIDIRRQHKWVLGSDIRSDSSISDCAEELVDKFETAVRGQLEALPDLKPVLALSGGLDSRSVLAAHGRLGSQISAYTSLRFDRTNVADVEGARELSRMFQCDWNEHQLDMESLPDFLEIVRNQEGGSSTVMAPAIASYRRLERDLGHDIMLFTGDGGHQVMDLLRPSSRPNNIDDLIGITAHMSYEFSVKDVARLLRLDDTEILDDIRSWFEAMPEDTADWKYAHYRLFVRGRRSTMEGEDRNRFFFWLAAPFWNLDFFKLSMSIPEKHKARFNLYREFLKKLDPKTLDVKYANVKAKPDSVLASIYFMIKRQIIKRPAVYRIAKNFLQSEDIVSTRYPDLHKHIHNIMDTSELLPEFLDMNILRNLLSGKLTKVKYHMLSTLILRMHMAEQGIASTTGE